ncbi:sugar transporter [Aspergillus ellipticus CBS 707.79]|uniref:Sugar transporter n=1 Tax=Aspergillus ellipticus CBS 707.79 TaxID=1448320 RepID=A0A319DW21_9EURO|nr:sugar transporter [Aspergillus ellipticus CBS 707.79]
MPPTSPNTYVLQVFLITAPAFILYGYNQAGLSALLDLPVVARLFPPIDTVLTSGSQEQTNSTKQGAVNACFQLGALIGSLSCSYFRDAWRRHKTILMAAVLALIGQVLQACSFELAQFIVGRLILGLGVGQLSVMVPLRQSESSKSRNRGRQVITAGMFICVGFSLSSWIDFGCSKVPYGSIQWRLPLALPCACSISIAASIMTFPESPRWLGTRHATNNLFQLKDDGSRLWWRFTLCMLIQLFQQTCRGNLISIYTTEIFGTNLGLSGDLPRILAATSLTWKLLCSFIAFAGIDRLGRRRVFIISGGMATCMIVMAIATSFPTSNTAASITAAGFIFIFSLCYPIGVLGGNFLYCNKIAPAHLRAAMSSVSTANHWLWNFVITMITPPALPSIGWKYYIVFACISSCIPAVVYFFFPETSHRSLEAIEQLFRDAPTIWQIVPMARDLPRGELPPAFVAPELKKDEGTHEEHREWA